MKIEKVTKKDGNTVIVQLDDGQKMFLSYEVFLKNGLRKNDEISDGRFSSLITENQLYHIKQRALRYLGRRHHSVSELRIKLRQKSYDAGLINSVIEELKEKKFLDDKNFAVLFTEENLSVKKWGKNKLRSELLKRGITREIIDEVLAAHLGSDEQTENAEDLARKKYKSLASRKYDKDKLRVKLLTFLSSRGYDYDVSKIAVEKIIGEEEADY